DSVVGLLQQALADGGRDTKAVSTRRSRSRGSTRAADTDQALSAAGIEPGDPRLYHEPTGEDTA
ncbi:MAG: hypothetical protein ACR2PK_16870, partial [Acidimicrobiales bacterium]